MTRPKSSSKTPSVSARPMRSPAPDLQVVGLTRTQGSAEDVNEVQTRYIQNLQQQIYFLELEVSHLALAEDSNRAQPALKAEVEKMTQKVSETKKESDQMKVEAKRKETRLDLLNVDHSRLKQHLKDLEERHRRDKSALLDEVVSLRKTCEIHVEKETDLGVSLNESRDRENKLRVENSTLKEQAVSLNEQHYHCTYLVENFRAEVQKLQNDLLEKQVELTRARSGESQVKEEFYKSEIHQLNQRLEHSEQSCRQERHLRDRVTEDNTMLLNRHADLEMEIATLRAHAKEDVAVRASLESVHGQLVSETAKARSVQVQLRTELDTLEASLQRGNDKCGTLGSQLNDEQRRRTREELGSVRLKSKMMELEERLRMSRQESATYQREATIANDRITELQKLIHSKDHDFEQLSQRLVSMQAAVTEFQQLNTSAVRVQGNRWRQLMNLAEGIQSIGQSAVQETFD